MSEKLDNIELRSEEVQEILTKVPHWMIRWGNVLFMALIIMLLLMSWFVKYPDVIMSEALITTSVPPQKEYARITGELKEIFVEDNDEVVKNQPLAILENTANHNDVFLLKSVIDKIQVNSKSFSFPVDSLPILFLGDIESQFALFENSYIQYLLNKELQPFENETLANNYTVSQLNRRLRNLRSQRDNNRIELELKEKELLRNKSLFDRGVISAQDFENRQLEYKQAERNFKNFESSISQIKEGISNAHKASRGTEISKIKEETILLKNVIQTFNQLKRVIKDWENTYLLKSDIDGKVSFLNNWSVNQTVRQGDLVFTIIPSESSSFIAKLKTPSQNSGKIKVGQKVNIKLENYPDTEFGVLSGEVNKVSLIPDEEGLYLTLVDLPKELITSYKKDIEFKHEMRGSAEIITEDLRLLERFFYRFKSIFKE